MAVQVQTQPPQVAPVQPAGIMKKMPGLKHGANAGMIAGVLAVVLLGVGSGWFLSGRTGSVSSAEKADTGAVETATEAGVEDESTFPDTAEGTLRKGGIEGEGTHYLERGSGPGQYAYLTSTVIDLESFIDKKVQVWGQTITSVEAPWLMDVGKIKVIE